MTPVFGRRNDADKFEEKNELLEWPLNLNLVDHRPIDVLLYVVLQCIENIHISGLLAGQVRFEESSSIRMLQSVRSDPSLFKDDPQIKFSRSTNSCRVPQIRSVTFYTFAAYSTSNRFFSINELSITCYVDTVYIQAG